MCKQWPHVDIYGIGFPNNRIPYINNPDYMADLDAVNILGRMSGSKDIMTAMLEYYSDLTNGKTNRAAEFVENLGGEEGLKNLKEKIDAHEKKGKDVTQAWQFYNSLKSNSSTLIE